MHHCCYNYLTLNVQVVSLNVVVVECSDVSLSVVVWDVALLLFLKEKENGMSVIAREENDTFQDLIAMTSVLIPFTVLCSHILAWVQTLQPMDPSMSAPRQEQSLRLLVLGDPQFGSSSHWEVCISGEQYGLTRLPLVLHSLRNQDDRLLLPRSYTV